jgi:hypothetical protein
MTEGLSCYKQVVTEKNACISQLGILRSQKVFPMRHAGVLLGFLLTAAAGLAQPRVDSGNLYERILAVVPMTGAGTFEDPRRPLFAPPPQYRA